MSEVVARLLEVLYLEAPPIQLTPPTTSILDVDQNLAADQNLEDNVEASIASHTAILSEDAETAGSTSSDAANEEITGEAAANLDADTTGPSGHAPQQTVHKADLVKKFVTGEAPVPWSETPRGKEWTKELNSVSFVPSEKILVEHLAEADEMLINDDFKAQLRVTALSTRHLQGQHSITHDKVNKIQEALIQPDMNVKLEKNRFFKPAFDRIAYIEKTPEKQQTQIEEILQNQASHQNQLNEIQSSVELLVSFLLPADAKKGEKVIKSKCKSIQTLKGKDDGNDDQGNSNKGRGQGQGKGFSSSKARITSKGTSSDTGRRISSDTGKRISSGEHLELDEEISKQLFLKENPGMNFESLKEEEARLKAEGVKTKSKASVVEKKFPKPKGIVIKERTSSEATKAKSQMKIDPRSKGKEKVDEPVKVYMPVMDEEVTDDEEDANLTLMHKKIFQTTSDMVHVVQSQDLVSSDMTVMQAISDIAQVGLISEDKEKETSDIAHVKPSKILLIGFTKAKQAQALKTATSGFEARVVTGKEARDKSGLGSSDERRVHNTTNYPTSLSEPGVGATPERLNRLESVQMVYHTFLKEHILLYFMTDGRVYQIKQNAITLKYFEKLEHVLFLLQVKDRLTDSDAGDHKGDIVEMKPNSSRIITTFLGYKAEEFNLESDKAYLIRLDQEIRKVKINDLREAIFQTGEDTAELINTKRRMVNELEYAEICLLKNYLRMLGHTFTVEGVNTVFITIKSNFKNLCNRKQTLFKQ
ncbi:hypothetical protein AgCh_038274 [Apium graveolens]